MFCIDYFSKDPRPFFKFAREIYPGQFKPSPSHQYVILIIYRTIYLITNYIFYYRFIKVLEKKGRLLRNYTQNIDTLEQVVGINNVIECHGMIIYFYKYSVKQYIYCFFNIRIFCYCIMYPMWTQSISRNYKT